MPDLDPDAQYVVRAKATFRREDGKLVEPGAVLRVEPHICRRYLRHGLAALVTGSSNEAGDVFAIHYGGARYVIASKEDARVIRDGVHGLEAMEDALSDFATDEPDDAPEDETEA